MKIIDIFRTSRALGLTAWDSAIIVGLHMAATIFEGAGIGMLLPIFDLMESGKDPAELAASSKIWQILTETYSLLGIEISFGALLITTGLLILLRQILSYIRQIYLNKKQLQTVWRARNLSFQSYLKANSAYHDREGGGDMVNHLILQINNAVGAFFTVNLIIGLLLLTVFYVAIMLALSVQMTVVALFVFGICGFLLRDLFRKAKEVGVQLVEAENQVAQYMVERFSAVRLIRLTGILPRELRLFSDLTSRQRHLLFTAARLQALLGVMIEPLVLGAGLVFLFLGNRVFGLGVAEMGVFLLIILRLLPVLKELMGKRQSLLTASAFVVAVSKRLDEMNREKEPESGKRSFDGKFKKIRFENVAFSYPQRDGPVLQGVNLDIEAGTLTALVGPSGAGKSTLVDMLPRVRLPDEGQVTVDGVPLADFDLTSLRNRIAFTPQTPEILDGSIEDHIRVGCPTATMAEIEAAAELSGAAEFIRACPDGYLTRVGRGGRELSGGQQQRLDLARALAQNAKILIMDEPTSNLDSDLERQFRQAISRIRRDTDLTVIVIAHRLSTIADADKIAIMDKGQVVAVGTHQSLIAKNDWYASAHRSLSEDSSEQLPIPVRTEPSFSQAQ